MTASVPDSTELSVHQGTKYDYHYRTSIEYQTMLRGEFTYFFIYSSISYIRSCIVCVLYMMKVTAVRQIASELPQVHNGIHCQRQRCSSFADPVVVLDSMVSTKYFYTLYNPINTTRLLVYTPCISLLYMKFENLFAMQLFHCFFLTQTFGKCLLLSYWCRAVH